MRLTVLAVAALTLAPAAGEAQPREPISRVDVAATVGSFNRQHENLSQDDDWTHSFFRGVSVGYYWTDHTKTELEVAWGGTDELYRSVPLDLPDAPPWARVFSEHAFDETVGSLSQTYQFGRNAMFHPFLAVGVDVVREEETVDRPAQYVSIATGRSIFVPAAETSHTSVFARPFFAAGFKAYVSERGFFRTDLKFGLHDEVEQVVWKIGMGFDF